MLDGDVGRGWWTTPTTMLGDAGGDVNNDDDDADDDDYDYDYDDDDTNHDDAEGNVNDR